MKFIVTTNFDENLLEKLESYPVEWISGRLPMDEVGGSTQLVENTTRKMNKPLLEKYIEKVHRKGWKFNYLLDGTCLGNKEYSWTGKDKIIKLIEWIADSGADGVTVTIPHLVETIKERFANLKVGYGSLRVITEMQRVKYYKDLGVDWIILHTASNRHFLLLKNLRKAVDCQLWLTANSGCTFNCNYGSDHDNFLSHATNYTAKGRKTNYFNYSCAKDILEMPYQLIKAPWIRPEDIKTYEELGYGTFQIHPNSKDTDEILKIVKAYNERRYNDNLLDLLSFMGKKLFSYNGDVIKEAPYLDNALLDDFLSQYKLRYKECLNMTCAQCGFCVDKAQEAIVYKTTNDREKILQKYQSAVDKMLDGEFEI